MTNTKQLRKFVTDLFQDVDNEAKIDIDVANAICEVHTAKLENLILLHTRQAVQKERERIKSALNPGLKELQYIGKAIGVWHEVCEELGLEVVWQDIGDDVLGDRQRPIRAITHSPLKAYHEVIQSQRELDKANCRHEWKLEVNNLKVSDYENMELAPRMATKKVCVNCGLVDEALTEKSEGEEKV